MAAAIEHIRKKLADYQPQERGDHNLNPGILCAPPYRSAAVLIPVLKRGDVYTVLFTKRTSHLSAHAGQVSFPGGRADETDKTAVDTALREAAEEIGLSTERVKVLGRLDDYITGTGFRVVPVVGLIDAPQEWTPDRFEVEEIFEVPLDHVLAPGTLSQETVTLQGVERHYYAFNWNSFYIWGATAGMLRNLIDVVTRD